MSRDVKLNFDKSSGVDFDVSFGKKWYVPSGGKDGQVLTRKGVFDYTWEDPIDAATLTDEEVLEIIEEVEEE